MSSLLRGDLVRLTRARINTARLAGRASGAPLIAVDLAVNLLLGVLPVIFVIASAVMVGRVPAAVRDGSSSDAWRALLLAFTVAAVSFIGQQIVAPVRESVTELVARRVDGWVIGKVMAAATGTVGIGALENPRVVADLRTAARELESFAQSPGQACAGLVALVARYTQLLGYVAVVGVRFSWLAAAGLLIAVLLFRYGQRGGLRKYAEFRFTVYPAELKYDYLRALSVEAGAAKEIRVFGLIGWLRGLWHASYLEWLEPVWATRRRIYLWPYVWFASWGLLVSATVFALLGHRAAGPGAEVTLTSFVMVSSATLSALRLGEGYRESDLPTAVGMHAYDAALRFIDALTEAEATDGSAGVAAQPAGEVEVPELAGSITFDKVSFRYPGQDRMIFDGLDLTIPIGRCTAIVGVNGAGKTTLVKLLARLYEPTAGTIRLNGVDIRSYPVHAWRAKLAVIFQDFARYEMSAADNVALGAVGHSADRAGIRAAIEAVGLQKTLDALPRGIDTPLARHLTDGTDLSGGQWQRVALARALFAFRHGSQILVLDEPTASLDVRAEAGFFSEFTEVARGATTLLISHRFSTVRQADLIVVLENGRVTEQGSHQELLALDGRYAHLFRLQAHRFTDAEDSPIADEIVRTSS
ncbi:MAG TPA: ABC transporter ATP-binding protein [Jatrophihabitans sp.]|jgi:ATP-binding cassette subfamily B protein|uniref:ABC transporter ATP-binding protein n=1 Tax=Jatrophihabitans sp. TaxID=1932789 RepID=UPI002EFC271C